RWLIFAISSLPNGMGMQEEGWVETQLICHFFVKAKDGGETSCFFGGGGISTPATCGGDEDHLEGKRKEELRWGGRLK
ncbi:hypothetical protein KI387_012995, partial [Taxus chinensis]